MGGMVATRSVQRDPDWTTGMRSAIEATAVESVLAGGAVLRERFDHATTSVTADFGTTDVKADVAAEQSMLSVVRDAFPLA